MLKIPRVSNYKEYVLTSAGLDVVYTNGRKERLIANRSLMSKLALDGKTISSDGYIISNNNEKNIDEKPEAKNNNTKHSTTSSKSTDGSKQKDRTVAKPKEKAKPNATKKRATPAKRAVKKDA